MNTSTLNTGVNSLKNAFDAIRRNSGHILMAFTLLILPGLLFAVAGVEALATPCHVSPLNALPVMLFFMAAVAVGLGVYLIADDWQK